MKYLLRRLWSAAKEWRSEKHDAELLKKLLKLPCLTVEEVKSDNPVVRLLEGQLRAFAESDLDRTEVRIKHTISSPVLGETLIPSNIASYWRMLLWKVTEYDPAGQKLVVVTGKGPVSVLFTQPMLPVDPQESSEDLLVAGDALIKRIDEMNGTFIFTKIRPA